jgi:hypothetical protein
MTLNVKLYEKWQIAVKSITRKKSNKWLKNMTSKEKNKYWQRRVRVLGI